MKTIQNKMKKQIRKPDLIFKKLSSKSLSYIASLINSSTRLGLYPDTCKIAIIITIYNVGNPNSSSKTYTPTSNPLKTPRKNFGAQN